MNSADFTTPETGRLVPTIQGCMAFIPAPLPPPILQMEGMTPLLTRAAKALGELNGIGRTLQNPYLLIRPFMRREAVASSKIEGTVSDLSDLLLFELDEQTTRTPTDAREVFNYVRALEKSISALSELPVSNRLIKDAHRILLTGVKTGRGSHIVPGEFKRDQNWIGARLIQNARFVPAPPEEAEKAMGELEKFINTDCEHSIPFIVKLALVHYQFETIHPFPDGNGRVGRLLIPLMLIDKKEMSLPLLYLSSFFEGRYEAYIDKMLSVSKTGTWGDWIEFFLEGVEETCNDAIRKSQNLQDLQTRYRSMIQQARASALLVTIIDQLFEQPAVTLPFLCKHLGITYNSAKKHVNRLVSLEILRHVPQGRPKTWIAREIFDVLVS